MSINDKRIIDHDEPREGRYPLGCEHWDACHEYATIRRVYVGGEQAFLCELHADGEAEDEEPARITDPPAPSYREQGLADHNAFEAYFKARTREPVGDRLRVMRTRSIAADAWFAALRHERDAALALRTSEAADYYSGLYEQARTEALALAQPLAMALERLVTAWRMADVGISSIRQGEQALAAYRAALGPEPVS